MQHAFQDTKLSSQFPKCMAIACLALLGIAAIILGAKIEAMDGDAWWLLASGCEILENGIPYTNPWSIHDGQGIVIQQWVAAVILYALYGFGGMQALELLVMVQSIVLVTLLFVLYRVVSRGRSACDTSLVLILVALPSMCVYWSVRPHLWSMIFYTALLIVLERYRTVGNPRVLVLAPIIAAVHVNFHASMAILDIVIVAVYLLPNMRDLLDFFSPEAKGSRAAMFRTALRMRVPLIVTCVVVALALLLNPYGIKGAAYTILSYGVASYREYINEMGSIGIMESYGISLFATALVFMFCLGAVRKKNFPLAHVVLAFVLLPMGLLHTRNVWLFPLFAMPLLAYASGTFSPSNYLPKFARTWVAGFVVACACAGVLTWYSLDKFDPSDLEDAATDGMSAPKNAVEYLESQGRDDLRVMVTFDSGGYFEWHGLKVNIDARPELWEPGITGIDQHWYKEFVDLDRATSPDYTTYIEQGDYDYVLSADSTSLYYLLNRTSGWQMAATGNGYTLWENVTRLNRRF